MSESDAHSEEEEEPIDDTEEEIEVPEEEPAAELVYRRQFFHHLRRHLNYSLFILAAIAIPVGVLAAYGTYGFRLAFGMLDVWLHKEGVVDTGVLEIFLLIAGGLLFGWTLKVLNWDRFRTPAHVIVAVSERDGKIPLKDGIITALADALSLGMGAPVGRYGPAIYLGATLGSAIARLFSLGKTSVNILLGCGVAAAISASFNAPIAGVIFAHEVIIGHFRLRAFAPITLASVAAVAITRFHNFEYVALKLFDIHRDLTLWDYPLYLVIGLVASVIAMIYMSSIIRTGWLAQKSNLPIWVQPAIGGAVAGIIALWLPEIPGLGDSTVQTFLSQDVSTPMYGISALVLLCLGKLIASSVCLGLRMPGGSFSPAIFVGSALGAVCGMLIPSIDYQIAVLVGMGALVSSVMGAPLATILIVFELTENYEAATAVMVGVVASNAIVTRYYARSLFHRQIRMWGIDISRPEEQRIMQARRVSEVMEETMLVVHPERTVAELRRLVQRGYRSEVFVVDDDRRLIGQLSLTDLVIADENETAEELAEFPEIWLKESDSVWAGFVSLENFEGVSVPVVNDSGEMQLTGVVFASDFVASYRDAIHSSRADDDHHRQRQ